MKKVKKMEKPWASMSLIYTLLEFLDGKDVKKLRQDIENDPIIKDQMVNLGCIFVCTFGYYLAPVLVAVHTVNNLDLGDEPENEVYESGP